MDRNIRLYPLYLACRRLIFWLPVFFLYFSSVLRIDQVLLLEAIYYLGVVVLEVPSGYFSDRVGRRVTLLISTGSWIVGGLVFVMTASFVPFAVAQLLLALGMAFNSGTDTALLYDSLKDQGREDELARQEARAQALGLVAVGIAAGVGGLLAGFDLRIAYLLSSLSAALAWAVAWHFREPPRSDVVRPPVRQIVAASQRLRDPQLRWIFVFVVGMTVLNHVPYEFFQPWLELRRSPWPC